MARNRRYHNANKKRDVNLKDMAEFIEARARVANHPIYGKITSDVKRTDPPSNKRQPHQHVKNYAIRSKQAQSSAEGKGKTISCPSCEKNHWLSQCDNFKKMNVNERHDFVRMKKLCINCLTPNHFVRNCPKRSFCRIQDCSRKHSTFLHLKDSGNVQQTSRKEEEEKGETKNKRNENTEESNNGYATATSTRKSHSRDQSIIGLAVVPVKVRAKGGSKMIETYNVLGHRLKHHLLHRTTNETTGVRGNKVEAITNNARDC